MASFYLPKAARGWFKHIQGSKETGFYLDFDLYYFCLLVGLKKRQKDPSLTNEDIVEIIRDFPGDYKSHKHFIVAFFLRSELEFHSIKLTEKTALDKELSRLLDPKSPTDLSEEGMKELNQYAFGGFRELKEYFPEPPRTLDGFLVGYYGFLEKTTT